MIAASAIVEEPAAVVSQRFPGISYADLSLLDHDDRYFLQSLCSRENAFRRSPLLGTRYSQKLGQIFENEDLL